MDRSTGTTTTPSVVGGQNYETYWVSGSNVFLIIRAQSNQDKMPNEFYSDSIIAKNFTEVLSDNKNISLVESKSKITLTIWIACIKSYMEDNLLDTIFCVYDLDLKIKVYLLYYWRVAKDGKSSKCFLIN